MEADKRQGGEDAADEGLQQGDGEMSNKNGRMKRNHLSQDFVITREMPNQQSKNRIAYNYRTPT